MFQGLKSLLEPEGLHRAKRAKKDLVPVIALLLLLIFIIFFFKFLLKVFLEVSDLSFDFDVCRKSYD